MQRRSNRKARGFNPLSSAKAPEINPANIPEMLSDPDSGVRE